MTVTEQDRERAAQVMGNLDELTGPTVARAIVAVVAQALADAREWAIEPFTALADEMQRQIDFRRETGPNVVADVRETDLRWLRLAISNARDPR